MPKSMHAPVIAAIGSLIAASSPAQTPRLAFGAPARDVSVATVQFDADGATPLAMDVYQRPSMGRARAALVFFNRPTGADRRSPLYEGWARAAASHDLVGIVPDLRDDNQERDFHALIGYLAAHGSALGIDTTAIAVYAASGNVWTAWPLLERADATSIRAAVIYYGTAPIAQFRRDLPVLYVRAGLDRPSVNSEITALASRAIAQNAPVTLLNHPTGYHGFELFNDDDATRAVIEQTLDFVRQATSQPYRLALAAGSREAAAAGAVQTGNYHEAAVIYAELRRSRPQDARLGLICRHSAARRIPGALFLAACVSLVRTVDLAPPGAQRAAGLNEQCLNDLLTRLAPAGFLRDPGPAFIIAAR